MRNFDMPYSTAYIKRFVNNMTPFLVLSIVFSKYACDMYIGVVQYFITMPYLNTKIFSNDWGILMVSYAPSKFFNFYRGHHLEMMERT